MIESFFWPGTKILKSRHNDFNWRDRESVITKDLRRMSAYTESGMKGGQVTRKHFETPQEKPFQKIITAFSKAKPKGKK